jgi:hypothetical protein
MRQLCLVNAPGFFALIDHYLFPVLSLSRWHMMRKGGNPNK